MPDIPSPRYPTPNYDLFGSILGNLPNVARQAQSADMTLDQQRMKLGQEKAFADGVPLGPDGKPDIAEMMNRIVKTGGTDSALKMIPDYLQQRQTDAVFGIGRSVYGDGAATGPGASYGGGVDGIMRGVAKVESGGQKDPYAAMGPPTKSGDRAYGKYQVMGSNVPAWTKEVLGVEMSPREFLGDPEAQEAVARAKLGDYLKKTGSPQDAASMWFTGKPLAQGANRRDVNGMSGARYAALATGGQPQPGGPRGGEQYASLETDAPTAPPTSVSGGSMLPRSASAYAPASPTMPMPGQGGQSAASSRAPQGQPLAPPQAAPQASQAPQGTPGAPSPFGGLGGAQQAMAGPSIASIISGAVSDPRRAVDVATSIGRALKIDPGAPLPPEVAQKAKTIIQNYLARTGQQQAPQGGPQMAQNGQPQGAGGPQGAGPIIPMPPLPNGIKDPRQAIQFLDNKIQQLVTLGPQGLQMAKLLEARRNAIEKAISPMAVRPGETLVDPQSRHVLFQAQSTSANNVALQHFLAENPNASPQEIQSFMQAGRAGRSGVAMFMNRFIQEHPDATAEDVAHAAQNYQSQGTGLTRFTSGPQGNAVKSFNVLVDHLGTLEGTVDALKNGNVRLFNQLGQEYARQTGGTAPTNFMATKALVGDELVKAIVGGGGALGDREEVKAAIDKANSPAQLYGVINQYRKLALGQLHGLQTQYEVATGRDDFDDLLAPGTKEFFNRKQGEGDKTAKDGAPKAGVVEDGYRFKGGDPSKKENWEKVD